MTGRHMFAAALAASLGACGEGRPELNEAERAAAIENVAEARPQKKAEPPPPALIPLTRGDLERALAPGAGCDFSIGDRLLFVAAGGAAVARVNGLVVRFRSAGPLGPTGGFFDGGRFSVSVGRLADAGVRVDERTSWPARLSLTDRVRDDNNELRLEGAWRCGG